MTPTEQKDAPAVAATTNKGEVNQSHRIGKGIDMHNATTDIDALEWPVSNNVTVTETNRGPAVVVTADTPLNVEQTRRLVRDLLEAQRFIKDTFEPIPFVLT